MRAAGLLIAGILALGSGHARATTFSLVTTSIIPEDGSTLPVPLDLIFAVPDGDFSSGPILDTSSTPAPTGFSLASTTLGFGPDGLILGGECSEQCVYEGDFTISGSSPHLEVNGYFPEIGDDGGAFLDISVTNNQVTGDFINDISFESYYFTGYFVGPELASVPEPAVLEIFGLGLLWLAGGRRLNARPQIVGA